MMVEELTSDNESGFSVLLTDSFPPFFPDVWKFSMY